MSEEQQPVTAPVEAPVWALWRAVKKPFPVWSLFPSAFWTPGAFGYIGVDHVSGFRRNASTKTVFALLEGRADEDLDGVTALAALNCRRQRQMFTAVAVAYVTIPLTLVATWAEVTPGAVEAFLRAYPTAAVQVFVGLTVGALYYFASYWRARQILEVLDLVRIERGARPSTALELRDSEG